MVQDTPGGPGKFGTFRVHLYSQTVYILEMIFKSIILSTLFTKFKSNNKNVKIL